MSQTASGMSKPTWLQHIGKSVAVLASTGAALVSIITALFSYGFLGKSESHQSIGNYGAAWVRLNPIVDTAYAIGDTIRFAATIADKNGSILVGAQPTWTSGDSSVATVAADGAVIARGPGVTTVSCVVGSLVAQAHIMVRQRVAGVVLASTGGDSALSVGEGKSMPLHARAIDARGHSVVRASTPVWHVDDSTVVGLDAQGMLTGRNPGRTVVSATIEGASGYLPIAVVTVASALDVVGGNNQRTFAGKALPQPVVVRATTRRGAPAVGKVVRFRTAEGQAAGTVQPDSVVTDADGRARASWTLGALPGRQTLLANVENVDSALAIVAEADPEAANTRVAPLVDMLHAHAGETLLDSVGVRVTDTVGRALPDVPVRWVALQGSAEAITTRTDSLGVARAKWTLAKSVGMQKLRAYIGGASGPLAIPPVSITTASLAGSAADIVILDGDNQKGVVGTVLKKPIVLRVVDANGNGVSAFSVTLSLSGGLVSDSVMETDSTGTVRVRWTMGRSAGEYSLAPHVDGVKKLLKLTAHAAPAAPANLSFEDAPAEKGARSQTKKLVAVVTDIYGNPVPDAAITLSVKAGMVSPARAIT
ncbi:MAG TPA: Ig-like domain-containing protein, partial [Gemmatimonadaceae bacterium]|nr:Ig-like domain-containing protein [Gemmatimonadaceae bacterium]